ncbi:hypothetical protein ABIB73_003216 [Bradyrhizobium sp. F1.4.3]|uniref:hypothetical protein n=1 Tax=Bradyrhizobium sp. F1.4.3 TaxID=3156356 RepID=UPI0033941FF9
MSQTASNFIVQRLHQWGVRHIFGYPGDGINGEHAKNFVLALMKGDPNESGVIKGAARQVLESILPGKE